MGRKKKKLLFDDYEEYEDSEPSAEQGAADDMPKVHLCDFVITEKVSAFVRAYDPCDEFDAGAERFDDGRLREYFKAYVCALGDPLGLYLEDLKMAGFRMETSLVTGDPCIFAKLKL